MGWLKNLSIAATSGVGVCEDWVSTKALVLSAPAPLHMDLFGAPTDSGFVRVLVDAGSGPVVSTQRLHLEGWLLPGMEVAVRANPRLRGIETGGGLHPLAPEHFVIDWQSVPAIETLVADNDPLVADVFATHERVRAALRAAWQAGTWGAEQYAPANGGARDKQRFDAAIERARQHVAPEGRRRAVLAVVSMMRDWRDGAAESSQLPKVPNPRPAVLSVTVPGHTAYAILEQRFHFRRQGTYHHVGLPALVSAADSRRIEILWGEAPKIDHAAGRTRIAEMQQLTQANLELRTQIEEKWKPVNDWIAEHPGQLLPQWAEAIAQETRALAARLQTPARDEWAETDQARWLAQLPGQQAALAPDGDPLDELERLGELRAAGKLSEAEFAQRKARLLTSTETQERQ